MLYKTAGQRFHFVAFNSMGRVSGQAASMSCDLSIDNGSRVALSDALPTEIGTTGEYYFDLTEGETDGHCLSFAPRCSVSGVQVLGMPSNVIYTESRNIGLGANSVVITVNDGASPLQGATVRIYEGVSSFVGVTNVSGQVTFNSVHNATFAVSIAKFGYTFAGVSLVVDGNETVTYSMTLTVIAPSASGTKTGYFVTYDPLGVLQTGVTVRMSLKCLPTNHVGHVRDDDVVTVVSDGSGVAQFTGLIPGARYYAWRGNRSRPDSCSTVQIPLSATDGFQIGSISGLD